MLRRERILPENQLPTADALIAAGRGLAERVRVGRCAFLTEYGVDCEAAYKRARMDEGVVMLHAQVGYRDAEKSRHAYGEIHSRLAARGIRLDRYGICLDWSMGYPAQRRAHMPRGTGLILDGPDAFTELTACAPVAPHFGDFVIGTPAALENTVAALGAGATSIGNLGQYFTFRQPHWDDDVATTAETIKALALIAAQPEEIIVHSNLDDGFAATFRDAACALGAVLIERYIVEDLLGAQVAHCYGHTYSDPLLRLAFQRALAASGTCPGTMVYGNTTLYGPDHVSNYAALASYLLVDVFAQRTLPTGHAVNPVPVTEAERIPEVEEIVDAHRFAARLLERSASLDPLSDSANADRLAERLLEGGRRFRDKVLDGLSAAGIDTRDALELLLSLRRVGARQLEAHFGPGELRDPSHDMSRDPVRQPMREPLVASATLTDLESKGRALAAEMDDDRRAAIETAAFTACLATTDVHEYGKVLMESLLGSLGVALVDAGVSIDPEALARSAQAAQADFIAISTYNGIALDFVDRLNRSLADIGMTLPVFIGGKLNQVPEASNTSLPVDVSAELRRAGALPCHTVSDMLSHLAALARKKEKKGTDLFFPATSPYDDGKAEKK